MGFGIAAGAAPVGNPAFPKLLKKGLFIPEESHFGLRMGYEGDFVGDGQLKRTDGGSGRIDSDKQETNSGTATFTLVERLDVYGVFGSSRSCLNWRFSDRDGSTKRVQLETKYRFLWAVGARAILYEWGDAVLGAGGRYAQTESKPSWVAIDGIPVGKEESSRYKWNEWQVDLSLSYQIDMLVPYIGAKYSQTKASFGSFPRTDRKRRPSERSDGE